MTSLPDDLLHWRREGVYLEHLTCEMDHLLRAQSLERDDLGVGVVDDLQHAVVLLHLSKRFGSHDKDCIGVESEVEEKRPRVRVHPVGIVNAKDTRPGEGLLEMST